MSEWVYTTIGAFAPFSYGKGLPKRVRDPGGSVKVFGSSGSVDTHTEALVDEPGVIIGRKGSVGVVSYSDGPFWPIDTTFFVTGGPERDVDFTYYLLRWVDLTHMNSDSAVPGLNRDAAHARAVQVPRLELQRRIGSLLRRYDKKRHANEAVVRSGEHYLREVLARDAARLPKVGLGDLASFDRQTVKPSNMKNASFEHFSIPAYDDGQVPERCLGSDIGSNKFLIEGRRVLVSRLNPRIPRVWWVEPETDSVGACSTEFLVLRPHDAGVPTSAVWMACVSDPFSREMVQRATGTSGSHQRVAPEDALSIDVPDVRLLDPKTLEEAESILLAGYALRAQAAALDHLRDQLADGVFSQRLRLARAGPEVEA